MKRAICAAASSAVVSCAAGTALNDYPRRVIDRPYTLPPGVADWTTGAGVAVGTDKTRSGAFINIPLSWDFAVSQDWEVSLGEAFGLAHQFMNDGRQRVGAGISLSPGFSSDGGVLIAPSMRVDHRFNLAHRWGWNSAVLGNASRWTGRPGWSWGAGAGTGPIFQVTDVFALGLSAELFFARSYLLLPGGPLAQSGRLDASTALAASWSLGRQWDLDASIGYRRRANENGYQEIAGSVSIVNFW